PPLLLPSLFTDPATTQIYTLSLHDALPISQQIYRAYQWRALALKENLNDRGCRRQKIRHRFAQNQRRLRLYFAHDRNPKAHQRRDRKSTRLNSSHVKISYAVFCLKKKTQNQ